MWGRKYDTNKINFEWPTQEVFDKMNHDVKMKSIEFSDNAAGAAITSVRCYLSDG